MSDELGSDVDYLSDNRGPNNVHWLPFPTYVTKI